MPSSQIWQYLLCPIVSITDIEGQVNLVDALSSLTTCYASEPRTTWLNHSFLELGFFRLTRPVRPSGVLSETSSPGLMHLLVEI